MQVGLFYPYFFYQLTELSFLKGTKYKQSLSMAKMPILIMHDIYPERFQTKLGGGGITA